MHITRIILITAAALCLIQTAAAVSITQSPDYIETGDMVRVSISGLADGSSFSLLLESQFDSSPGADFSFSADSFVMPITLADGEISAYTENTVWAALEVQKGHTSVRYMNSADDQGIWRTTQSENITAGTYDFLRLQGETREDANEIVARFGLTGTKLGPDSSQITFTIGGVETGTVRIIAMVDGAQELNKLVTVGSSTPTPTAVVPGGTSPGADFTADPTSGEAPLEVRFTDSSTNSPGSWYWVFGDGATSTEQHPVHIYTEAGTYSVSLTVQNGYGEDTRTRSRYITVSPPATAEPEERSFTSVDGRASFRATGVEYIGVMKVAAGDVPGDWSVVGAYSLAPADTVFSSPGVLSFALPDTESTYFIATDTGSGWSMVPSRIEGGRICCDVASPGTYCLATFAPEGTATPTTVPATTGAGTASATTPASPVSAWVIISAIGAAILILRRP
ncbi:MAG: PKD domain-containing protein [Methanomicrobiales archaeon]